METRIRIFLLIAGLVGILHQNLEFFRKYLRTAYENRPSPMPFSGSLAFSTNCIKKPQKKPNGTVVAEYALLKHIINQINDYKNMTIFKRSGTTSLLVLVSTLSLSSPILAAEITDQDKMPIEQVIEPEIDRRDVKPPVIDAQDFEINLFAGIMSVEDFGTNLVYGARFGYHVTEKLFIQGSYGRTDTDETSFEVLSGAATLLEEGERNLSYWNFSLGYNLLPGEAFWGENRAFNNSLYLTLGAGNTQFAGDEFFTWSFGFGYRVILFDSFAVNMDFKDHIFDSDILGAEKTTHNLEGSLGLSYFF